MARRLLLAVTVAVLGIGLLAPPASAAGTVTRTDPAGDGTGVGDVRALKYSQNANTGGFLFQVRLAQPTRITARTWAEPSATELRFNIATDGGPQVDYVLAVVPADGGPTVTYTGVSRGLCGLEVTFPQPTIVRVRLNGPICVDGANSFRVFSRFRFDQGGNGSIDSDDRAPNVGYGGAIPVTNG
jgi:hypothetical protein